MAQSIIQMNHTESYFVQNTFAKKWRNFDKEEITGREIDVLLTFFDNFSEVSAEKFHKNCSNGKIGWTQLSFIQNTNLRPE